MADWEWFFASEYGRDRILRDRLTDLEYEASSATSSSARLSSQLAHLQGSVESRLTALSAAFDAYVELGDVREELARYADRAELRTRAGEVVRTLSDPGSPAPTRVDDPDGTGYWLVPATNALIAVVGGERDHEAEAAARSADPEADLFLVAAGGALDRGAAVADLLPGLFSGRDRLDDSRVLVFRAVLAGHYGPVAAVLPELRAGWEAVLAEVPPADGSEVTPAEVDWSRWVLDEAGAADRSRQLGWLLDQVAAADPGAVPASSPDVPVSSTRGPDFAPPATDGSDREGQGTDGPGKDRSGTDSADAGDPAAGNGQAHRELRDDLRGIVVEMISAGTGAEADLLRRARLLRARIESPQHARELEDRAGGTTPTLTVIRRELVAAPAGGATRAELFGWVRPALAALVDRWAAEPVEDEPVRREVRTPGGVVPVDAQGPDPTRLAAVRSAVGAESPELGRRLTAFAVAAALLLVVAVVVAFTKLTALAVLALIGAVVCGVLAFRAHRARAAGRREREVDRQRLESSVEQAVTELREVEDRRRADQQQRAALLDRVRTSLRA